MFSHWTFGQKLAIGYIATVLAGLLVAITAVYCVQTAVAAKDRALLHSRNMIDTQRLHATTLGMASGFRGFLLTGDKRFEDEWGDADVQFKEQRDALWLRVVTEEGKRLLDEITHVEAEFRQTSGRIMQMRKSAASADVILRAFEGEAMPKCVALVGLLGTFSIHEKHLLDDGLNYASQIAFRAQLIVIALSLLLIMMAGALLIYLTRSLHRQVAAAVRHIQSSATQLQSATNQVVSGSKQQASVMTEITITIKELLMSARKIAENAQRVADVAGTASDAARKGDEVVGKAQSAVKGIKRQFDQIIERMLGLGKTSQQIGGILDIVNELAEQTNILAINATIEAAGAGEGGRRFAALADEIRKLADRVTASTKEIHNLVEEIRSTVDTTVMSTESSRKVVEEGTREVGDVAVALSQIVQAAATTTDAAREIELSTKQQSSAVDQVNTAISDVAQSAREFESSASQTQQTSSLLMALSRDLASLIEVQAAA